MSTTGGLSSPSWSRVFGGDCLDPAASAEPEAAEEQHEYEDDEDDGEHGHLLRHGCSAPRGRKANGAWPPACQPTGCWAAAAVPGLPGMSVVVASTADRVSHRAGHEEDHADHDAQDSNPP